MKFTVGEQRSEPVDEADTDGDQFDEENGFEEHCDDEPIDGADEAADSYESEDADEEAAIDA